MQQSGDAPLVPKPVADVAGTCYGGTWVEQNFGIICVSGPTLIKHHNDNFQHLTHQPIIENVIECLGIIDWFSLNI